MSHKHIGAVPKSKNGFRNAKSGLRSKTVIRDMKKNDDSPLADTMSKGMNNLKNSIFDLDFHRDADGGLTASTEDGVTIVAELGSSMEEGRYTCGVSNSDLTGVLTAVLMKRLGPCAETPAAAEEAPEPAKEENAGEEKTPSPKKIADLESKNRKLTREVKSKSKAVEDLKRKLDEASGKAKRFEELSRRRSTEIDGLNNTVERLRGQNKELRETANAPSSAPSKDYESIIAGLQSRLQAVSKESDEKDALIAAKDEEIFKLKEMLRASGFEGPESAEDPSAGRTARLVGPTEVECSLFRDGRYTVLFAPRIRSLRFIPDPMGDSACRNCTVKVPGIREYSDFEVFRDLQFKECDGFIEVMI